MSTVLSSETGERSPNSKFLSEMMLNSVSKKEDKSHSLSDIGIVRD